MGGKEKLKRSSQFAAVYELGKTWAGDLVVLKVVPNGLGFNRYGFVAGKGLGKAVVRNRGRILRRKVARATPAKYGWDLVFVARSQTAAPSYHELEASVTGLLRRSRILAEKEIGKGTTGTEW